MIIIKTGSVTRSRRARDFLSEKGIRAEIRRLPNDAEGCSHGVIVPTDKVDAAIDILIENDIIRDRARTTVFDINE